MYTELLQKPAKYVVGQPEVHRTALMAIQAEKLQLTVELDVLVSHLEAVSKQAPPSV